MIFYLDFDYTLFDTYAFRNELYKILRKNGLDQNYLALTSETEEHELLNVRKVFEHLSKDQNIPLDNFVKPLDAVYMKSNKFVYGDVINFLKWLKSEGHSIYILTWGDEEYQSEKVKASGLDKFIDGAIFTEKLKYTLDIDYENAVFIDDSIRDLKGLYNRNAKCVFRMKRKHGKNSKMKLDINEILEFDSLRKIRKYLIKTNLVKK